ncbi:MAG: arylsulfatase [Chloroherpetonaceae bacterium]|nr:arylsulfatase [Chthonomonadaceae bacterium]MDW8209114.1 arylsulfatase [Chloroherpetonaceae bacterium]
MPARHLAITAIATLALLLTHNPASRAQNTPGPNIIFILADDLGYGDLGCYGQKHIRTPHLDRMAREGMRFTQFYAGSTVCAPSRSVLMTGLHTGHTPVRGNSKTTLPPGITTIASLLKQAGYITGHFGKWGLGDPGSTGVPTKQGFDEFFGYLNHMHAHNNFPTHLFLGEQRYPLKNVVPDETAQGAGKATVRAVFAPDLYTEQALQFIERNRARPFFLYLAYTIPHANNEAGPDGMETPDYGPYARRKWPQPQKGLAALITRLDTYVGRVLNQLKRLKIDRNTLLLFSSDNGPHREGGNDPAFFQSSGPLRGIKRDLYEGGIRVPFIARWPGVIPPGTVSSHIGSFQDMLSTFAEVAGLTPPPGTDSISILPTLRGQPGQQQHPYLYWEFHEQKGARAVRMGRWKGVRPQWHAPTQLFDLETDIGEQNDLAAQHPDIVAKIEAIMKEARTPSPEWPEPE